MEVLNLIIEMAKKAKEASYTTAKLSASTKKDLLLDMALNLEKNIEYLQEENKKDLALAKEEDLSPAFMDRLLLNEDNIKNMVQGVREVAQWPDPVGEYIWTKRRPNGLLISKVRTPLGVIAVIYESRPNVTVDAASLCLKSGNAIILRGGKEAINSNKAMVKVLKKSLMDFNLPLEIISMVEITDHQAVTILSKLDQYLDVIIPRGGENLIQAIKKEATVPVVFHGKGNCHLYLDEEANLEMASKVTINAKVQRPGVCNAIETLLVHKDIAGKILPGLIKNLQELGVEIRGCPITKEIANSIKEAKEEDWQEEYLSLILAVKVVKDIDEAISHIRKYGSLHSEGIITNSISKAYRFAQEVDASAVFINTSTRFNDGSKFGLGAEIGISTQKLHARGPMGIEELTSFKYFVLGDGQIRE
ncbi:glutamate-5-semialdehyde dehydrogenase [bacterium]|nr:glutamate-5-semialdehyde dehydrogenase [bacterium]MBU1782423.1 glutamate-5-semialdehyde dehydrogenase [bacterium]MBU2600213.1 glutamate-5-semialdehyde dehydrogenase [bacterium]